jgi:hypothetical protein
LANRLLSWCPARPTSAPRRPVPANLTLVGSAGPGDTVTGRHQSERPGGTGTFQILGVTLAAGANILTVQAEDLAGNTTSSSPLTVTYKPPTGSTPPNAVIVWNQATLDAIRTDGTDALMASRALAMVQVRGVSACRRIS